MKILIITGSFPLDKCGVGDYACLLAENLASLENVDIHVLTSKRKDSFKESTNRFQLLDKIESWNLFSLRIVIDQVKKINPDIIHIQYPTTGYGYSLMPHVLPFIFKYIFNFKIVETWHEPLSWRGLFRYISNAWVCDDLIVVEPEYLSFLPNWYCFLLKRKRMHYIPIGSAIPSANLSFLEKKKIKHKYTSDSENLICYFGFASPSKGIEQIFKVANPITDFILLMCELDPSNKYHKLILDLTNSTIWKGRCFVTGYLCSSEVCKNLAASDVAIYPFINGYSSRNGSVLAARVQGTYIVTTSNHKSGFSSDENTYYCLPNNIDEMKSAIRKTEISPESDTFLGMNLDWNLVADSHLKLYSEIIYNS
jgi:glycosyltransferase involved in cell wall biosynthesis